KLFVIDRLGDGRRISAHWTLRIATEIKLPEFHFQCIEIKQPANKRFADAEDQLDRFIGLNRSNDSRQNAQHAGLRAIRHRSRRWGFGKQTAVAWSAKMGRENCSSSDKA